MYKRILVVVDDRVVTQSVIKQAIVMAQALRADIHFFYTLSVPEVASFDILPVAEITGEHLQREATARAQVLLGAASELAERAGIQSFQVIGPGGEAAQSVADAAARKQCDLIMVGTEGRNAVLRLLSGSIVPRLISAASVPVLVCRDTGSDGGIGRRTSVSMRARQRRRELLERRCAESND